jgi:CBS domain containing-hemolysin-like protein
MLAFTTAVSVALIVSFMCSIFESVLLSVGHAQVEALAAKGKPSGKLLQNFKRRIDIPIAAILIVNTMAHTVGAAVAGATYENVFEPGTLWIFTIVFTVAVLFFTEIVPKTLGVAHSETLATPVAYGIYAMTVALRPLVAVSERVSRALRRGKQPPVTSIEEIRLLALLGRREGIVGPRTADIIVGATRLKQLRVADVMLPRSLVTFIPGTHGRKEVLELIRSSGHSRFPFSPIEDIDEVSGVILAKDLLFSLLDAPEAAIDWARLVREPLVVPRSKPLNTLLKSFQDARSHMALVVDEYGDFEGIVTMEDVLEEIVGEIDDEHDADDTGEDNIQAHGEGYAVSALTPIAEFNERFGCSFPDEDYDTIGGLVTANAGYVPAPGDHIEISGFRFQVTQADDRRVHRFQLQLGA